MKNLRNILLTGGAGYIGSHVALSLLNQGYSVTIIDSLITGNKNLIPKKANFIKCDFSDTNMLRKILKINRFDVLIHLAAFIKVEESIEKPRKYLHNNYEKSSILFDTCIRFGLNNFIFSSTAAVYGNAKDSPVCEKVNLLPLNPYAESKMLTEKYLIKLSKTKQAKSIILRYFNVAGADSLLRSGLITNKPTHLIKIASEAAVNKRDHVVIYGNDYSTPDGTTIRDYIHVSDLAEIHTLSLKYLLKNKSSVIMNCGYGYGYSVKSILDQINLINKKPLNIKIGKRRKGDIVSLVADVSKIKKILKWKPKNNRLKIILKSSINWEKKLLNEKNL